MVLPDSPMIQMDSPLPDVSPYLTSFADISSDESIQVLSTPVAVSPLGLSADKLGLTDAQWTELQQRMDALAPPGEDCIRVKMSPLTPPPRTTPVIVARKRRPAGEPLSGCSSSTTTPSPPSTSGGLVKRARVSRRNPSPPPLHIPA